MLASCFSSFNTRTHLPFIFSTSEQPVASKFDALATVEMEVPTRTYTTVPESPSLATLQDRIARAIGRFMLETSGDLSHSTVLVSLLDDSIPGLLEVWILQSERYPIVLREIPGADAPDPRRPQHAPPGLLRFFFRIPGREGFLVLGRKLPFSRGELRTAIEISAAVATVFELRQGLLQRTQLLRDDFDLLVVVTQELSRCQTLDELYESIAREGVRLLKQRKHNLLCLQRYSAALEELTCVALSGEDTDRLKGLKLTTDPARARVRFYPRYDDERLASSMDRQETLSFTGSLIKSKEDYLLIADVEQLQKHDPYYCLSPRTRSELAVPIVLSDGARWGVLNVENPQPNAFSELFDLPLLQGFARIISVFLQELDRRDKTYTLDDIALPDDLKKAIRLFAQSDESVLITGETGTGKEVVARALHYAGARRRFKFIPVNCGAIEPNLMMSELFGYTAHAFSGAGSKDKAGLFMAADKGTIFLDEIENMPMAVQEAVLRVVERGEVRRVGGTQVELVDVRVVAATNMELRQKIAEGSFRQDLYYRLKILELTLPPLRDRRSFIPDLFLSFVNQYRRPLQPVELHPDVLPLLQKYSWPGNVRELRNLAKRMLVLSNTLSVELLPDEIKREVLGKEAPPASTPGSEETGTQHETSDKAEPSLTLTLQLDEQETHALSKLERQLLQQALNHFNGDKYRVASFLGISPPSVYRKIKEYGLQEIRRFG